MAAPMGRLIIYTSRIDEMVEFYRDHFGFREVRVEGDRIVELRAEGGGASILLHPASRGKKLGQTLVKLVFDVEDVPAFCGKARERGLIFGPIHQADGYVFANAKDPSNNAISVSSRAFAG